MRLAVAPTFIPEDVRRHTISLNRGYKGLITVLGVNPFCLKYAKINLCQP